MKKNEESTNCDCGQFSHQMSIELPEIEVSSKKPLPKSKAPFWMVAWWWICWVIGWPWQKVSGKKEEDSGLNSFIFLGIIAATMFVGCTNNAYKPLSENRNMLRDTLSEVKATSKLMATRKSIFNIPRTDLSVIEETRIHENPEENNVWVVIKESNKDIVYNEDFSPKNIGEFYASKEEIVYGGYFHLVSTNSNSTNCFVRHRMEVDSVEVVIITPKTRYFIEYYLNNLWFTPIGFLTGYAPPTMREEERKDNY